MTGVLYSNNFNGLAANALLPEFVAPNAANADFKIEPNGTGGAASVGANGYGNNNPGYGSVYNAGGSIGRQVVRFTIRLPDASSSYPGNITPVVMADTAGNHYRAIIQAGDSGGGVYKYGFLMSRYEGGNTTLLAPSYTVSAPSGGGFVEIELEARPNFPSAGQTTLNARMWSNGGTYPASPTATVVDSSSPRTSGFPGLEHGGGFGWILAGNLVITDGSVSSGVFDAPTDTTAPIISGASVANSTPTVVNITMSEAMDTGFVPAASAFTVGGHTVSSVAITGSAINLTVSTAFVNGEAARTVAYIQPGTNNARDLAGNLLANFTGQAITNNVAATDTTAPTFSSAQVANAAPANIVITMSEALAAFTPAASAFAVSGGKTVSSVARSGATVTLTCSAAYANGDTITVTYTKPGSNMLQDAAGNQTASFGPSAVTNNVSSGATVTITSPAQGGKRAADGMYRASVPCNVTALDKTTHAVLERKTGLTSPTSGPFVFTSTVLVAGTERLFLVKSDADDKDLGAFFATPV